MRDHEVHTSRNDGKSMRKPNPVKSLHSFDFGPNALTMNIPMVIDLPALDTQEY
ncbi:hypothetical protein VM1G_11680 [Cytospora mali]|uniref:Uncharacterized protein n=1 Tax=Cytospora mali TaxID=578113 RepID=A0A194W1D7_CYTMA|nr:hypothetical protein VM1G_11680 [Valsa mali]